MRAVSVAERRDVWALRVEIWDWVWEARVESVGWGWGEVVGGVLVGGGGRVVLRYAVAEKEGARKGRRRGSVRWVDLGCGGLAEEAVMLITWALEYRGAEDEDDSNNNASLLNAVQLGIIPHFRCSRDV